MKAMNRLLLLLLLIGSLAAVGGCTTDDVLDDDDSAPVQLEIQINDNPPVQTQDDPEFGCTFNVEEWTATAFNIPKNAEAITSPFNDIVLDTVSILYAWDAPVPDGFNPPVPRVIPLTGTVPANGTLPIKYTPIFLDDVVPSMEGRTAALTMTFRGRTVAGESVTLTTGDTLSVNECTTPPDPPDPGGGEEG